MATRKRSTTKRTLTPDDIPPFYRPFFRRSLKAGVPIADILDFVRDLDEDMHDWTGDVVKYLRDTKPSKRRR